MEMHASVLDLSVDIHGCWVIQRLLMHGSDVIRNDIFNHIEPHLLLLIKHPHGNHVIQKAIQFCAPHVQSYLINFILEYTVFLSIDQHSSNVVKYCIDVATPQQRKKTMDLICLHDKRDERDKLWLKFFCIGPFSNYVVQKLIEMGEITQVYLLYTKLEPSFKSMKPSVCGRIIIKKLTERLENFNQRK